MSDHERGPYTPPTDRLAFDPRQPVRSGPAPVTLIASALVLLAMVGGVVFVYRHGFRHGGPPAVVGAPVAQMKTAGGPDANAMAPTPPAGLQVEKTNAVAFAPPPEQPAARPTVTQLPPPAATPPVAPIANLPPQPTAATNSVAALRPAKPLTIASIADAAVASGAKPAKPAAAPSAKIAAKPAAKPMPAAAIANPTPGAGWIQVGAYSSAALADKGWDDVSRLAPDQMVGKGKRVQQVEVNGKTFYRAYVTGFYSAAAAGAFCDDLKTAGHACIVR